VRREMLQGVKTHAPGLSIERPGAATSGYLIDTKTLTEAVVRTGHAVLAGGIVAFPVAAHGVYTDIATTIAAASASTTIRCTGVSGRAGLAPRIIELRAIIADDYIIGSAGAYTGQPLPLDATIRRAYSTAGRRTIRCASISATSWG
jgi:hypothetical protein